MAALQLLVSLLWIVGTWIVLYSAIAGIGLPVLRWMYRTRAHPAAIDAVREGTAAFWVGLAIVLLFLQAWHVFLPVTGAVTVGVVAAGLALMVPRAREVLRPLGALGRGPAALIATGLVVWFAMRALGPVVLYDSGMYHVPFVNWVKAHAIVPGLGNLHGRFAFNPASLLLAAMLDQGPWIDGASHIMNGLLMSAFVVHAVAGAKVLVTREDDAASGSRIPEAFAIAVLPAVIAGAMRQDIRSLSTDVPAFLLVLVASFHLLALLTTRVEERGATRLHASVLVTILAAAISVKLSSAVFAAIAGLVALVSITRVGAGERAWSARATMVSALLVGLWLVRGAILSGYPLYPSQLLALPVDWRVSAEQAAAEASWITMSARVLNTNDLVPSGRWLGEWLRDVVSRGDLVPLLVAPVGLALAGMVLLLWRRSNWAVTPRNVWRGLWLLVPIAVALVAWWITAPHPRLAQGLLWSAAGCAWAIWTCMVPASQPSRARGLTLATVMISCAFAAMATIGEARRSQQSNLGRAVVATLLASRTESGAWIAPMPRADLLSYRLPSGIEIAVPRVDNSCWNGPLLCTPHPVTGLRFRHATSLASGFRIDGAWDPQWFPNPWIDFLPYWRCIDAQRKQRMAADERACLPPPRVTVSPPGATLAATPR